MPDHNNTTNSEIEKILKSMDGYMSSCCDDCAKPAIKATTQLQNLITKERQTELAQTILAGMPGLTPTQQDYITNRITALEKTLKESTDV